MISSIDFDAVIALAGEMVRIPSVLGNEGALAEHIASVMKRLAFDEVAVDHVGNVIGVKNGDHPGPTLLIDGHMDTVDVQPEGAWSTAPFSGTVQSGRLYGRGSSDMKGALAAMIHGVASLERGCLAGRCIVSASVGEETSEGSAMREVVCQTAPDFVVIGESTDLNLAVGGRGRSEFLIETEGRPAHASTPQLGRNAVHEMISVIGEVEKQPMPEHGEIGKGTICLTDIISEPYPAHSVVPSRCRVTYERRLVPGDTEVEVIGQLKACCRRAGVANATVRLAEAKLTTYTGVTLSCPKWYPPWSQAYDHRLVRLSIRALRSVGLQPRLTNYQFCTNAALTAGFEGRPTIGFGPSSEQLAHTVDEYVEVEQLIHASRGYAAIVSELLARPNAACGECT